MKGEITISRRRNNIGDTKVYLEIIDSDSRVRVIDVEMTTEDFVLALTGLGMAPCEINKTMGVIEASKLGKKMENKTVFVDCPPSGLNVEEQRKFIVQEFYNSEECRGWVMFNDGLSSQQSGDKHRMSVRRWVEKEEL